MYIQKAAVRMKTGLVPSNGPRLQGASTEEGTRRQETRPRSVSSMATKIDTAWSTTAATPTASPVIHSDPVVPKVEAATRLSRRPEFQPQRAGSEYKSAWQAMALA